MPKINYLIPVSLLATQWVGCEDPVIDQWVASSKQGVPFPEQESYAGCTYSTGFEMIIDEDFKVSFFDTYQYQCYNFPPISYRDEVDSGSITIITPKKEYQITLPNAVIDCSFIEKDVLQCNDEAGAEFGVFERID